MADRSWTDADDKQFQEWLKSAPAGTPSPKGAAGKDEDSETADAGATALAVIPWPTFQKIMNANHGLAAAETKARKERDLWRCFAFGFMGMSIFGWAMYLWRMA